MKRKTILGLTFGLVLSFMSFIGNSFQSIAMQQINSPQLQNSGRQLLEKKDNSGLEADRLFMYVLKDNYLESFVMQEDVEHEKVFAIITDPIKNNVIDRRMSDKSRMDTSYGTLWNYSIENVSLPKYLDNVDIQYYKQSSSDPDFTIKSKNFLGKSKLIMPGIMDYQRGSNTPLTVYDKDWKVTDDFGKVFLSRITPNYYAIQSDVTPSYEAIGKIVLPQGQEDLMSEDEKTIPIQEFYNGINNDNAPANFNFYIPNEVTEFKFIVYDLDISDEEEDILYQYHIKLDRK